MGHGFVLDAVLPSALVDCIYPGIYVTQQAACTDFFISTYIPVRANRMNACAR